MNILGASAGIFGPFADFLGKIMSAIYSVVPSYGMTIIIVAIVIRILIFPLTMKQSRSMVEMQRLQPHLKRLQAKYRNDRQKLSEETMALYRANNVNPLASCLPLLVQMPLLSGLFWLLRDVPAHVPNDSELFTDVCGVAAQTKPCKNYSLDWLGMDLANSLKDEIKDPAAAWPYILLVAVVVIAQFISTQQHQRRQKEVSTQIKVIGFLGPALFAVFGTFLPSGLPLAYAVAALIQIGQNEYMFRTIYREDSGTEVVVPDTGPEPATEKPTSRPQQGRSKKRKRR